MTIIVHRFITNEEVAIRPFTEKERQNIHETLRKTGRSLFAAQGWRRTSIDDLCKAAAISRGSFYLFHASKDAFFLSLLAEAEVAVKQELLSLLSDPSLDGPATLRVLLDQSLTVIERHPLLRFAFADPGEPAPWMRALGSESLEVMTNGDGETAAQVLKLLAAKGLNLDLEPEVFAGLLRALVLLPLSRKTIGEAVYEAVRTAMLEALTRGLA